MKAPIEGPAATPSAVIDPHFATVAVRWETGVEASSSPSEEGVIMAPPTPCATRAAIMTPRVGAAPTSNDATAKTASPTVKSSRRP